MLIIYIYVQLKYHICMSYIMKDSLGAYFLLPLVCLVLSCKGIIETICIFFGYADKPLSIYLLVQANEMKK